MQILISLKHHFYSSSGSLPGHPTRALPVVLSYHGPYTSLSAALALVLAHLHCETLVFLWAKLRATHFCIQHRVKHTFGTL